MVVISECMVQETTAECVMASTRVITVVAEIFIEKPRVVVQETCVKVARAAHVHLQVQEMSLVEMLQHNALTKDLVVVRHSAEKVHQHSVHLQHQ